MTTGSGSSAVSLEMAKSVRVCGSLAAPELMPVRLTTCGPLSSATVTLEMTPSVGASFTGSTVTTKARLLLPPSASVTVIVTVTLPN